MIGSSVYRLEYLCNTIPGLLSNLDEKSFSFKPSPQKWSKQQVIGHLIDSATNNHHRLVRGQFEDTPGISYDQDKWNENNYYQEWKKEDIISFWKIYNQRLIFLIKRIPPEKLSNKVKTGGNNIVTLQFVIEDYVIHMEHHLKQVVDY